jgi:hypothetical protein
MINEIQFGEFLNSVKALVGESIKVYESHPDKEELIKFKNLIEVVLTQTENFPQ